MNDLHIFIWPYHVNDDGADKVAQQQRVAQKDAFIKCSFFDISKWEFSKLTLILIVMVYALTSSISQWCGFHFGWWIIIFECHNYAILIVFVPLH